MLCFLDVSACAGGFFVLCQPRLSLMYSNQRPVQRTENADNQVPEGHAPSARMVIEVVNGIPNKGNPAHDENHHRRRDPMWPNDRTPESERESQNEELGCACARSA